MKSCQDLEHLLDDFVDGETTPDERRQVDQHLAECSECRGVVGETRALLAATATLGREIPPGTPISELVDPGGVAQLDRFDDQLPRAKSA